MRDLDKELAAVDEYRSRNFAVEIAPSRLVAGDVRVEVTHNGSQWFGFVVNRAELEKVHAAIAEFLTPANTMSETTNGAFQEQAVGECPACDGAGETHAPSLWPPDDDGWERCPTCDGSGQMPTAAEIAALRIDRDRIAGDLQVAEAEVAAYRARYAGDPHPFDQRS